MLGDIFAFLGRHGFTFAFLLLALTAFTLVVILVDIVWQRNHEKHNGAARETLPKLVDYSRSFFPILLIVLLLRSFVFQPYQVPTGSLEPTVVPGDLIFVEQFAYGLKMPVWNNVLVETTHLKRGDIALFHYPINPNLNYVKRVIGVPGDTISYVDNVLTINGKKMTITDTNVSKEDIPQPGMAGCPAEIYNENLVNSAGKTIKHQILLRKPSLLPRCASSSQNFGGGNFYNLKVPPHTYFMMGDNRDDSDDSRFWGFVPESDFIGKATLVWFNWNSDGKWFSGRFPYFFTDKVRWSRIGTTL